MIDPAIAAYDALEQFVREDVDAHLVLIAGEGRTPLGEFEVVNLLGDTARPFIDGARAHVLDRPDRILAFRAGYKPDAGEVLAIKLSEHGELQEIAAKTLAIEEMPFFAGDEAFAARFRAFATVMSFEGRRAAFYRQSSPKKELHRSGSIPLILTDNGFNRLRERVFLFDQEIDFAAWDDYLFIWRTSAVNALVPTFEVMIERVTATLAQVVPFVANGQDFEAAVLGQPQMRSKMMQIAARPYLGRLTIDDLKAQIRRRGLAITIERGPRGAEKLVFDQGRESRWLILKLLDDDYLDSRMTDEQYEVNSKLASG